MNATTALLVILQLIFLEGILSLDNAAVLGAMAASLPNTRPVPWPKGLTQVGRGLNRVLGPQRTAALRVGLLGAYIGRGLMLVLAAWVAQNLWLRLIGALYLIKLSAKHLSQGHAQEAKEVQTSRDGQFWRVVLSIELADLAFSLDNVVAAVALSDHLAVVVLGVAIGILAMRFAAGVFANLVIREPVLNTAAFILIFNIGMELLLEDLAHIHIGDITKFAISAGTIGLALLYAHWPTMHAIDPLLRAFARVLGLVNRAMDGALYPLKLLWTGFALLSLKTAGRVRSSAR
ncbi:MAG: tellurium resistance protein TerC [Anaerolineae bacterium]|nr:tellurium resistance protein TerC [Anaerolineae bacterium]